LKRNQEEGLINHWKLCENPKEVDTQQMKGYLNHWKLKNEGDPNMTPSTPKAPASSTSSIYMLINRDDINVTDFQFDFNRQAESHNVDQNEEEVIETPPNRRRLTSKPPKPVLKYYPVHLPTNSTQSNQNSQSRMFQNFRITAGGFTEVIPASSNEKHFKLTKQGHIKEITPRI